MAARKQNKFVARAERERRQSRIILVATVVAGAAVIALVAYALIYEFMIMPNRAVLVVNGEEINTGDFRAEYMLRIQQDSDPQMLASSVINTLTNQLLTVQEAKARGLEISDEDVDETIYGYFGFYPEGTPTPFPSSTPDPDAEPVEDPVAEEEEPAPEPTPTAYTREMFDENYQTFIEQWETQGVSEESIRASIRRGLYMERFLNELRADQPKVEDQVNARHILVETEEEALEVLEKLEEGEAWEDLAAEYSIDTSNAENGGDLGWFVQDRMVPEFADVAFEMEIGEVSEPVQTQFGWHIIEVLGHQERVLDQFTFESRIQAAYQDWLNTELEDAEVEIDQELVDEIVSSIFPGL